MKKLGKKLELKEGYSANSMSRPLTGSPAA